MNSAYYNRESTGAPALSFAIASDAGGGSAAAGVESAAPKIIAAPKH